MPIFIHKITEKKNLLLWKIEESEHDLCHHVNLLVFSEEIKKDWEKMCPQHSLRKKQFWAARVALGYIIQSLSLKVLNMGKNEKGKPYILVENAPKYVSISHSQEWVAVIMSSSDIGIDIEKKTEKLEKMKHKFLTEEEFKNLQNTNIINSLTKIWTAKESVYKAYGNSEIFWKDIYVSGDLAFVKNQKYHLTYSEIEDYIICIAESE